MTHTANVPELQRLHKSGVQCIRTLQEFTGETFPAKFQPWPDWWIAAHPDAPAIDWESDLGYSPRPPKEKSKSLEGK